MRSQTNGGFKMTTWKSFNAIKNEWMKDADFKKAYDALDAEHSLALSLIKARLEAGLTQSEIANRMNTTQSVIARIESGKVFPSLKTLYKYAEATGKHMHVSFD